ncbi:MAG TPA: hypothetical protein VFW98_13535 [Gemmatimonadaceae bacterium]|nr:hypothetical protein [Gemmatimonadaceae bacterium]
MPRLVYLTMLALVGCATSQQRTLPSAGGRTHAMVPTATTGPAQTEDIVLHDEPGIVAEAISAPLDSAWAQLRATYSDLNMPTNAMDAASHTIGTGPTVAHGSFAGAHLSALIDCGYSMNGNKADLYTVRLNVRTQVVPNAGGGTIVKTLIEATAHDEGSSTDPVACSTTGRLGQRIAKTLAARLK